MKYQFYYAYYKTKYQNIENTTISTIDSYVALKNLLKYQFILLQIFKSIHDTEICFKFLLVILHISLCASLDFIYISHIITLTSLLRKVLYLNIN